MYSFVLAQEADIISQDNCPVCTHSALSVVQGLTCSTQASSVSAATATDYARIKLTSIRISFSNFYLYYIIHILTAF